MKSTKNHIQEVSGLISKGSEDLEVIKAVIITIQNNHRPYHDNTTLLIFIHRVISNNQCLYRPNVIEKKYFRLNHFKFNKNKQFNHLY
jgi:hypothetical protein